MIRRRSKFLLAATALIAAAGVWFLWPPDPTTSVARVAPTPTAEPEQPPLPSAIARALHPPDAGSAPTATSTVQTVLLFGFVRDTEQRVISGATVRALPHRRGEALVTRSGAEGEYLIAGAPPILDAIEVSATGYVTRTATAPTMSGGRRVRYDVTLEALPGLRGLVRCAGEPVANARVFASRPGARHGHGPSAATKTGPDGRFALDVDALSAPFELRAWSGTCGEGRATTDGAPVTIDLEGGAMVSGRAIDARTQLPIPSFWVSASTLLRDAGGPPAVAIDDDRGEFTLGPLAPGAQRIYVAATGYGPASQDVELRAHTPTRGVVIALSPSARISGRVFDARTRRPIEGAQVAPAEWAAEVLSDAVGATTGPDGRYTLASLPGKATTVVASAPGYRTLMQGGVDGRASKPLTLDLALTPADRDGARPSNELVGIGAQLSMSPEGVEVMGVLPQGPAASKLRRGDVIVKVGDTPVRELDLGDVVQSIRGELGTEVELWIRRDNGEPQRIVFERARVSWTR